MKYLFTLLTVLVTVIHSKAIDSSSNTPERLPFLEQGKTWWYEIWERCVDEERGDIYGIPHHFGARIEGTVEIDGQDWTTCHIVDSIGNTMTVRPIAYLREENGKVFVTADHLHREYDRFEPDSELHFQYWLYEDGVSIAPSPYKEIIWRYANFIHMEDIDVAGESVRYDVDTDFPALVFDFSGENEVSVSWPWYYGSYSYPEPWNVEECNLDSDGIRPLRSWTLVNTISKARCTMIEGVGAVRIERCHSYSTVMEYSEDHTIGGLFFNPCQYVGGWYASLSWQGFYVPELLGVERPDGTLLYGDESRPWSGVRSVQADVRPADDTLYDLMGRRVEHPGKGSVYVRQGKKVVF